jgi:hypothetical protein
VDKEEYREFLNLGHGEIFNLDLDRWGTFQRKVRQL